jgi:hypothetical protein
MKTVLKKSGAPRQNSVLAAAAGLALLGGEFLGIGGAVIGTVVGIVLATWTNNHSSNGAHH